ncbi:response regulator transcription factor [Planktothrix agardhii]|jgi:twitching motility two-component system response regulator PilH|uniref:Protein PilG n=1 Tax=Planktothrix agardhii TaxID=1160 RepID=A0A1J1JAI8_PLAAG|nr:response regulator [Planktothrix agardhii]MBG0746478.1 response regulator [Planktothrix agardhii KL2]MCB8759986.1 response regulator [Planktothrix agardhii 1813]MCB8764248.1 response regulator [Planktothrix agardhii 1809]MCB8777905.1 response regulator [Planktothrix agardhii 1031]MCB8782304.1 response regulator [Planktothrix agardhii 1808]
MTTVMIVDDSNALREIIAKMLQDSGMEVISAEDGVQALEKIEQVTQLDLVVLDIVMPNMNGYELCRQIKKNPKTQNIPVVMCSSKSEDFDRIWGIRQGADAYISKPFRPEELLSTIKQLLPR